MNKLATVFAVVAVSVSAYADEVGNHNSTAVNAQHLELAAAEQGTASGWAKTPFEAIATSHQVAKLEKSVDALNSALSIELNERIEAEVMQRVNAN